MIVFQKGGITVNKKSVLNKASRSLCLIIMSLIISGAVALSGCTKEKATGPKATGPAGICEILDELPKDIGKSVEVNYEGKIKLLGITADKIPQDKLKLSYYWQPIAELGPYHMVFVHFTSTDDKGLFGNDHEFCEKRPFEELKGKFIKETYTIDIPASSKGEEVFIKIGFYDPIRGGRLKIESAAGLPTDDANTRAIIKRLKL
jgi:hypothetical protein